MQPQDNILVRGDTFNVEYHVFKDDCHKTPLDLTNFQIRYELTNDKIIIKKATANVSGGNINQIEIIDAINGIFEVKIPASETVNLVKGDYEFEIEFTSGANEITTAPRGKTRVLDELIDWVNE
jgi:hypothetical protein